MNDQELAQSQWLDLGEIIALTGQPRSEALRALKLRSLATVRPAVLTISESSQTLLTLDDRYAKGCIEKLLTPVQDWRDDDDPGTAAVSWQIGAFLEWHRGSGLNLPVKEIAKEYRVLLPKLKQHKLLVTTPVPDTPLDPSIYQAKVLRLVHAPGYLGMNKNKFNAEVRPQLTELIFGDNSIGFNRSELDRYIDRQTNNTTTESIPWELSKTGRRASLSEARPGTLNDRSATPELDKAFAQAIGAKQNRSMRK